MKQDLDPLGIGRRIRQVRDGLSLVAFGRKVGASGPSVMRYEAGQVPPVEFLLAVAQTANRSLEWIVTGKEHSLGGADPAAESGAVYEILKVEDKRERLPGLEKAEIPLVRVPILDDRLAARPGQPLDFSKIEDWARVPRWKVKRGNFYYMIRISGESAASMEPQFRPGDLILANLDRRDPKKLKNRLVAVWIAGARGATVRVLHEDEKGSFWILHARNSSYKDIVVPKDQREFEVAAVEAAWLNFE